MRRVRLGEGLAGLGGAALLADLAFVEWYRLTSGIDPGHAVSGPTGFESFSILDLYLALVAVLGIALPVLQVTRRSPAMPVGAAVLITVLGAVAVFLVAYRIVNQPGSNEFVEVRPGAWVGLLAALAVTLGAWLSLHNEGVRGLPDGPEPELRPPP
jgi:hypothetical protein